MPDTIKDGSSGNIAKVNSNNRLYTNSVTTLENYQSTRLGNSFNINTGVINLRNDVETPLIYIKNNEDYQLHIMNFVIGTWESTGGSGNDEFPKSIVVRNPNQGTIITLTPTDVDIISNRNYGSSKELNIDAFKGSTGNTMIGGSDHIILQMGSFGRTVVNIDEILEKGSSFGIKYTPQSGNTSQKVYAALICHLEDPKE